jgi:hypothetical protein
MRSRSEPDARGTKKDDSAIAESISLEPLPVESSALERRSEDRPSEDRASEDRTSEERGLEPMSAPRMAASYRRISKGRSQFSSAKLFSRTQVSWFKQAYFAARSVRMERSAALEIPARMHSKSAREGSDVRLLASVFCCTGRGSARRDHCGQSDHCRRCREARVTTACGHRHDAASKRCPAFLLRGLTPRRIGWSTPEANCAWKRCVNIRVHSAPPSGRSRDGVTEGRCDRSMRHAPGGLP